MAKSKPSLRKLTYNQMQEITGSSYRKIKAILEEAEIEPIEKDGNSVFFDSRAALPLIFEAQGYRTRPAEDEFDESPIDKPDVRDLLNPAIQSARLSKARTEKTELEIAKLKGELVSVDEVVFFVSNMVTAAKSKLLAMSDRVTPVIMGFNDQVEAIEYHRKELHKALMDLRDYDTEEFIAKGDLEIDEGVESTAEDNDQ